MATPRKSATKIAAREKARAAAAARVEREKKILAALEAFFASTLGVGDEKAALREKISALEAQVKELDRPRPEAAGHVRVLKDIGLANKEIAELLSLSVSEVGQYLRLTSDSPGAAETTSDETNTERASGLDD